MTETGWLACNDPTPMLEFLRGKASDRKLRLFACACCWLQDRSEWPGGACVAELFADGKATQNQLSDEVEELWRGEADVRVAGSSPNGCWSIRRAVCEPVARLAASNTVKEVLEWIAYRESEAAARKVQAAQADIPREIFGNPFRSATINPLLLAWNDGIIPTLAQAIYEERAFDRLPVLADALEDAKCDNADILNHLRGPGPHFRGCFAVDLALRKE